MRTKHQASASLPHSSFPQDSDLQPRASKIPPVVWQLPRYPSLIPPRLGLRFSSPLFLQLGQQCRGIIGSGVQGRVVLSAFPRSSQGGSVHRSPARPAPILSSTRRATCAVPTVRSRARCLLVEQPVPSQPFLGRSPSPRKSSVRARDPHPPAGFRRPAPSAGPDPTVWKLAWALNRSSLRSKPWDSSESAPRSPAPRERARLLARSVRKFNSGSVFAVRNSTINSQETASLF